MTGWKSLRRVLTVPLKKFADFVRFVGMEAHVKLRKPVTGMSNRKTFQGILLAPKGMNWLWSSKERMRITIPFCILQSLI